MIHEFRVQNYKALRDVALKLTPMHVLIGPNDSGKTSILEAVAALCRSVDHFPISQAFVGSWDGRELVWRDAPERVVSFQVQVTHHQGQFTYHLSCRFPVTGNDVKVDTEHFSDASEPTPVVLFRDRPLSAVYAFASLNEQAPDARKKQAAELVHETLKGVHYYRWDPRVLALPVATNAKRRYRMEMSGFGLAQCLDEILGYDRQRFDCLEDRFRQVFPHIKSIVFNSESAYTAPVDDPAPVVKLQPTDGKGIRFRFANNGREMSAAQASDGMLLVLAYLAVLHLPEPPRLLLVEEPENGIHPKRLQEVLTILQDLISEQQRCQVIMSTHSPYVLDHFKPEEVTLCRRNEDGSISTVRLSESRAVREQISVFTLGEIWTSAGDEALAATDARKEEAGG